MLTECACMSRYMRCGLILKPTLQNAKMRFLHFLAMMLDVTGSRSRASAMTGPSVIRQVHHKRSGSLEDIAVPHAMRAHRVSQLVAICHLTPSSVPSTRRRATVLSAPSHQETFARYCHLNSLMSEGSQEGHLHEVIPLGLFLICQLQGLLSSWCTDTRALPLQSALNKSFYLLCYCGSLGSQTKVDERSHCLDKTGQLYTISHIQTGSNVLSFVSYHKAESHQAAIPESTVGQTCRLSVGAVSGSTLRWMWWTSSLMSFLMRKSH